MISRDAFRNISLVTVVAVFAAAALVGFGVYRYAVLKGDLERHEALVAVAEDRIENLEEELGSEYTENDRLLEELNSEKAKMEAFQRQIEEITGAVGLLQRLQGTDRELLQKYSRTYFLSEHYAPSRLAEIEPKYLHNQSGPQQIHADVKPYLESMMEAADSARVDLRVVSAYRSAYEQSEVNSRYNVVYGRGANQFSAEQGYSEHQLGTTVDFTTSGMSGVFEGFESARAYEWLRQNAYQYGFILSYPENNPYYIFEPWHWRFAGRKLAEDLHSQGKSFYDMSQEEINEYLVSVFE